METIELATGKKIIRIETNDLDEMEEVRGRPNRSLSKRLTRRFTFTANEESTEVTVDQTRPLYLYYPHKFEVYPIPDCLSLSTYPSRRLDRPFSPTGACK